MCSKLFPTQGFIVLFCFVSLHTYLGYFIIVEINRDHNIEADHYFLYLIYDKGLSLITLAIVGGGVQNGHFQANVINGQPPPYTIRPFQPEFIMNSIFS